MKKTYSAPVIRVRNVAVHQMISTSIGMNSTSVTGDQAETKELNYFEGWEWD